MWTVGCSERAEVLEVPEAYNPDSTSSPLSSSREWFVWIFVAESVYFSRPRSVWAGGLGGVLVLGRCRVFWGRVRVLGVGFDMRPILTAASLEISSSNA